MSDEELRELQRRAYAPGGGLTPAEQERLDALQNRHRRSSTAAGGAASVSRENRTSRGDGQISPDPPASAPSPVLDDEPATDAEGIASARENTRSPSDPPVSASSRALDGARDAAGQSSPASRRLRVVLIGAALLLVGVVVGMLIAALRDLPR